ncbi:uncharacterized protein DFL_006336 [Arthrobotrys flagrans]|uniref:Uncharacterized protein n=1 Tax=Arthrobotrys flagrans TaxID=97331 RepID=A0A437A0Q0_ARTFL|nr:hypothetical protein DFL_006336 [Arthrobotrys flagrans]
MARVEDAPAVLTVPVLLVYADFIFLFTVFNRMKLQDILQSRVFNVCTSVLRYILSPSLYSRVVSVILPIWT